MTFIFTLSTIFTSSLNQLETNQRSDFCLKDEKNFPEVTDIQQRLSGHLAYNSLGTDERYHSPLRQTFCKIRHSQSSLPKIWILSTTIEALVDIVWEKKLFPSRIMLGIIPHFLASVTELPTQNKRIEDFKIAQIETSLIDVRRLIFCANTCDIPSAADCTDKFVKKIQVYSRSWKDWIGSQNSLLSQRRISTSQTPDESKRQTFNAFQSKPFLRDF